MKQNVESNSQESSKRFIDLVLRTMQNADLFSFNLLLNDKKKKCASQNLKALFLYKDEKDQSIFHHLLIKPKSLFFWRSRKRRHVYAAMLCILLDLKKKENITVSCIDEKDCNGKTPLHLAIALRYENLVKALIATGANISIPDNQGETPLKLAVQYKLSDIYKLLLKKHIYLNKEAKKQSAEAAGFSVAQIKDAAEGYKKNLQNKSFMSGVGYALMATACPIASILAFQELPVLELFLGSMIFNVAPIIGLVGAVIIGGLLIWSAHNKSSTKHGLHAQKRIEIEAKNAEVYRLEAELSNIDKQLQNEKEKTEPNILLCTRLNQTHLEIIAQLKNIYADVSEIPANYHANPSDWATPIDHLKAAMLTVGSFFCAFSGVLSLVGGISSFLPAALLTGGAVLLGIPIVGWVALGVTVLVAIGVAWAYQTKFNNALKDYGKVREDLHIQQQKLYDRKQEFINNLRVNEIQSAPSLLDVRAETKYNRAKGHSFHVLSDTEKTSWLQLSQLHKRYNTKILLTNSELVKIVGIKFEKRKANSFSVSSDVKTFIADIAEENGAESRQKKVY